MNNKTKERRENNNKLSLLLKLLYTKCTHSAKEINVLMLTPLTCLNTSGTWWKY